MATIPTKFPKVESPYHRGENDEGDYVIEGYPGGPSDSGERSAASSTDEQSESDYVNEKFSWVFDRAEEVEAIEKLDGTNMAVYIEHKHGQWSVTEVATRMGTRDMQRALPFGPRTNHHYITRAVQNSVRRGYIKLMGNDYGEGWYFGEALGPKFQSNPHELDEHLFVPFDWVRDKLEYQSYGEYSTEFEDLRDWFRGEENGLFSLFASRMHGQDLDASRPQNGTFVEGIIFVHPDFEGRLTPGDLTTDENGRMNEIAKLRRDMFDPFQRGEWPVDEYGH